MEIDKTELALGPYITDPKAEATGYGNGVDEMEEDVTKMTNIGEVFGWIYRIFN